MFVNDIDDKIESFGRKFADDKDGENRGLCLGAAARYRHNGDVVPEVGDAFKVVTGTVKYLITAQCALKIVIILRHPTTLITAPFMPFRLNIFVWFV